MIIYSTNLGTSRIPNPGSGPMFLSILSWFHTNKKRSVFLFGNAACIPLQQRCRHKKAVQGQDKNTVGIVYCSEIHKWFHFFHQKLDCMQGAIILCAKTVSFYRAVSLPSPRLSSRFWITLYIFSYHPGFFFHSSLCLVFLIPLWNLQSL